MIAPALRILLPNSIQTTTMVTQITAPDSHPDNGILRTDSQGNEHQHHALATREGVHANDQRRFLP